MSKPEKSAKMTKPAPNNSGLMIRKLDIRTYKVNPILISRALAGR